MSTPQSINTDPISQVSEVARLRTERIGGRRPAWVGAAHRFAVPPTEVPADAVPSLETDIADINALFAEWERMRFGNPIHNRRMQGAEITFARSLYA